MKKSAFKFAIFFLLICVLVVNIFTPVNAELETSQKEISLVEDINWPLCYTAPVGHIFALEVYDGNLYALASASQSDGRLLRYDGTSWVDMNFSSADGAQIQMFQSLEVFNGKLYLGGRIYRGGYYSALYSYDGISFQLELSAPGNGGYSGIEDLMVDGDTLYASNGSPASEVYQKVNVGNWTKIGNVVSANEPARTLAMYNGTLYVGTGGPGRQAKIWRWTGNTWELAKNIATDFNVSQDGIVSMFTYNNILYATPAGPGSPMPMIAFDGSNWYVDKWFSDYHTGELVELEDGLWVGVGKNVYQLTENQWLQRGTTGGTFVSSLAEYEGYIFAGTYYSGGIYCKTHALPAPTITIDTTASDIDEGEIFTGTGNFSDNIGTSWEGTVDYGEGVDPEWLPLQEEDKSFVLQHQFAENGEHIITVGVTNNLDLSGYATQIIMVNNVSPDIMGINMALEPHSVNSSISASADFIDPGPKDIFTAEWDWGDGSQTSSSIIDGRTTSDSHTYIAPGVYTVKLTVTDKDGGFDVETSSFIVIYDPASGFVTGGGWISSPLGAYNADQTVDGKASFGFVTKYKKDSSIPTGETEFQLHFAGFNFKSTEYQWLVLTGNKAIFRGKGTVNGEGSYAFIVTVLDGNALNGDGIDRFRMKIWNIDTCEIVYDSQLGASDSDAPLTPLGGGSIVIHKSN